MNEDFKKFLSEIGVKESEVSYDKNLLSYCLSYDLLISPALLATTALQSNSFGFLIFTDPKSHPQKFRQYPESKYIIEFYTPYFRDHQIINYEYFTVTDKDKSAFPAIQHRVKRWRAEEKRILDQLQCENHSQIEGIVCI